MTNMENTQPQPMSKRAWRRAKVNGEVGSDDTPKGQVRENAQGELEYRADDRDAWKLAVYHNDLRDELLAEANSQGEYDHPRERGFDQNDITAFHSEQKIWGGERDEWPDILFQIHRTEPLPSSGVPDWLRDGRVVLDPDNHPVRMFAEIPLVCSSKIDGWNMEAIRRQNTEITIKDFRARMPHKIGPDKRNLYGITALGMRMTRFREKAGCMAWGRRAGSDEKNTYLEKLIPDECKNDGKGGSTKKFRNLTKDEIAEMKRANQGRYPYRASGKNRPFMSQTVVDSDEEIKANPANAKTVGKRSVDSEEHSEQPIIRKRIKNTSSVGRQAATDKTVDEQSANPEVHVGKSRATKRMKRKTSSDPHAVSGAKKKIATSFPPCFEAPEDRCEDGIAQGLQPSMQKSQDDEFAVESVQRTRPARGSHTAENGVVYDGHDFSNAPGARDEFYGQYNQPYGTANSNQAARASRLYYRRIPNAPDNPNPMDRYGPFDLNYDGNAQNSQSEYGFPSFLDAEDFVQGNDPEEGNLSLVEASPATFGGYLETVGRPSNAAYSVPPHFEDAFRSSQSNTTALAKNQFQDDFLLLSPEQYHYPGSDGDTSQTPGLEVLPSSHTPTNELSNLNEPEIEEAEFDEQARMLLRQEHLSQMYLSLE